MLIKRNIRVIPKQRERANGGRDAILRLRIICNGFTEEIPLGQTIDADRWNQKGQYMEGTKPDSHGNLPAEINILIRERIAIAQDVFKGFEVRKENPVHNTLKKALRDALVSGEAVEEGPKTLEDALDEYFREQKAKGNWMPRTAAKWNTIRKQMLAFRPDLTMPEFNADLMASLAQFLATNPRSRIRTKAAIVSGKGLCNATVNRRMRDIKSFVRWAAGKGYVGHHDFEVRTRRLDELNQNINFLTEAEISQIAKAEIPPKKKHLERIRDILLFSCFTGLRFSDIQNLRRSDLGQRCMEVTTIKTGTKVAIQYNDTSRRILNKYRDEDFGGRALPPISNQKYNVELKELGRLAGINAPVHLTYGYGNERYDIEVPKYEAMSSHIGRRSFCTNAMSRGIPQEVVRRWTGHSSFAAMKPYLTVADSVCESEMRRMDWDPLDTKDQN